MLFILCTEGLRKEFGILVPEVTVIAEYEEQILRYDLSTAHQISACPHITDHYEVKLQTELQTDNLNIQITTLCLCIVFL